MSEGFSMRASQLGRIVFLCLAIDMAVRPFAVQGPASAQLGIPAAVLNTLIVCLIFLPFLYMKKRGLLGRLQGMTGGGRVFLILAAVLFSLAGASAAVRTEEFFRYVSDEPLPSLLFFALILFAVCYALKSGTQSVMRVASLTTAIFIASVALMLLSNYGSMHLFRLGTGPFDPAGILRTSMRGFTLAPELLLFSLFWSDEEKKNPFRLFRTLTALGVFYIVLTFCTQTVLGSEIQSQTQTVHTLSRLGSISVFRRLDALHIAIWMLAELCKLAVLLSGARFVLTPLLGEKLRAYSVYLTVGLFAVLIPVCMWLPQRGVAAALTMGTAFLIVYWMLYGLGRKWKHAKKSA